MDEFQRIGFFLGAGSTVNTLAADYFRGEYRVRAVTERIGSG